MCFGMGCAYEDSRGECKVASKYPPHDAACAEGKDEYWELDRYDMLRDKMECDDAEDKRAAV